MSFLNKNDSITYMHSGKKQTKFKLKDDIPLPSIEEFRLDRILDELDAEVQQVKDSITEVSYNYRRDLSLEINQTVKFENQIQNKNVKLSKLMDKSQQLLSNKTKKLSSKTLETLDQELDSLFELVDNSSSLISDITDRLVEIELILPNHDRLSTIDSPHRLHYPNIHKLMNKDKVNTDQDVSERFISDGTMDDDAQELETINGNDIHESQSLVSVVDSGNSTIRPEQNQSNELLNVLKSDADVAASIVKDEVPLEPQETELSDFGIFFESDPLDDTSNVELEKSDSQGSNIEEDINTNDAIHSKVSSSSSSPATIGKFELELDSTISRYRELQEESGNVGISIKGDHISTPVLKKKSSYPMLLLSSTKSTPTVESNYNIIHFKKLRIQNKPTSIIFNDLPNRSDMSLNEPHFDMATINKAISEDHEMQASIDEDDEEDVYSTSSDEDGLYSSFQNRAPHHKPKPLDLNAGITKYSPNHSSGKSPTSILKNSARRLSFGQEPKPSFKPSSISSASMEVSSVRSLSIASSSINDIQNSNEINDTVVQAEFSSSAKSDKSLNSLQRLKSLLK